MRLVGASRTDAGVHALGQVASLSTAAALPADAIRAALNALLPPDIRVLAAVEADPRFDARRWASGKRYAYLLDVGQVASPLGLRYAWHVRRTLDVAPMREALRSLRGRHDFSAFCAAPGRDRDPACTLRSVRIVQTKRFVAVLVSADSFLHHMVRNIVGSGVEVAQGRREPGWMAGVLASRDRDRAGPTAPARGLTLMRVRYPQSSEVRGRGNPPSAGLP